MYTFKPFLLPFSALISIVKISISKSKNTAVRKQKVSILHEYHNAIEHRMMHCKHGCMLHTIQGKEGASLRMTGDVMEARR